MAMGRVDVNSMLSEMSAADFERWRRFDEVSPFPDARSEIESARLLAFLEAALVGGEESRAPLDFLWTIRVDRKKAKQKQLGDQILSAFGAKPRNG